MKVILALITLTITSSSFASTIINCHVYKNGHAIVKNLWLKTKTARNRAHIWGPSRYVNFQSENSEGALAEMGIDLRLDGENLLAISLFDNSKLIASRRTVIASQGPLDIKFNRPNAYNLDVSCARN